MYEENKEVTDLQNAREHMKLLLEQMSSQGVELFVDGRAALPKDAAAKAVHENSPYMADYVLGDAGNIEQIRFDQVHNC